MFPRISDLNHSHNETSLHFDFKNVIFGGFSNATCRYCKNFDSQTVLLTLKGSNLDFSPYLSKEHGPLRGSTFSSKLTSLLQVYDYAIALCTPYDRYASNPFSVCITNVSFEITPNAERIVANYPIDVEMWREMKRHTQELVESVKNYFSLFVNDLIKIHNKVLCKSQNAFPTQATRTTLLIPLSKQP
ncbi:uncharacterized protein [Palaemon carinicauda]|uniref:uncharacterized protein n=1 Tax=Palaemon carinicauda TaxID=392227 RepID=UPI0035B61F2B